MKQDSPQPFMSRKDAQYIERALLEHKNAPLRVLEWGSGGSTVYFSYFLNEHGIDYRWVSLEYNRAWYEKVKSDCANNPRVSLTLFETDKKSLRQRNIDMEEYITYPHTLNTEFDLIIVDGRKRRRCLVEAQKLLKEDGVVVLHDAWRPYYHCALCSFPDRRFISPTMWRGIMREPSRIMRVSNIFATFFYRTIFFIFYAPFFKLKRIYSRYLMWKRKQRQ